MLPNPTHCPHLVAYATGLLLARRVLKIRELDQEYEGNVEVRLKQIPFKLKYMLMLHCLSNL